MRYLGTGGLPSNSPSNLGYIAHVHGQPGTGLPSPFQAYIGPELTPGPVFRVRVAVNVPTTKDVFAAPTIRDQDTGSS